MTTQSELIHTFLDGDNVPSTASNMRIIPVHGGTKAYLVGGYGDESHPGCVYAVREPINQLTAFTDFQHGVHFGQTLVRRGAIVNQFYEFSNIADQRRNEYQITTVDGNGFRDRERPSTRDFDDLDSKLHG